MANKNFAMSCILTAMDALVFILCVDRGLSPIAVVGACYVALRLFGRDSQNAVNLIGPAMDKAAEWMNSAKEKMEARKEDDTSEE